LKAFLRHRLRDAVFGSQDGLVSTLGALTGIAEGTQSGRLVVLSGFVIVAVESLSMAAGSYLSSKTQREYLEHLLEEERTAIATDPEGERREIGEMYRSRGYTEDEIAIVTSRLVSDPELLLEDMAHKELGICPATLEEPVGNAAVMGSAYVAGGLIPILPYLLLSFDAALTASIAATFAALFTLGAWKGRVVGRRWWRSGLEVLVLAALTTLAGFVIGRIGRFLTG
jgi:VIT1/CCC1 family predicted Fe2+/Mn2+ transporter